MFLIIILLIILIFIYYKSRENFDFYAECKTCKNKSYFECRNCPQCGVCTTELGDIYCIKGNENGPINDDNNNIKYTTDKREKNNKNTVYCLKYNYGNIYPQYHPDYYSQELTISNDARFYPFLKTLDDKLKTNYYNQETNYRQIYRDPLVTSRFY
jgi:hypothetical protein